MLNLSLSETRCLAISGNRKLSSLLVATLGQIGINDVAKEFETETALLQLKSHEYNLVIGVSLEDTEYFRVLATVRYHIRITACRTPVILFSESWTSEQIAQLRDAGVSVLATFPINMRSLLKQITRAMNDPREFIMQGTYRGPCRRRSAIGHYHGPLRRQTDVQRDGYAGHSPVDDPELGRESGPSHQAAAPAHVPDSLPVFTAVPTTDVSYDPILHQTDQAVEAAIDTARDVFQSFGDLTVNVGKVHDHREMAAISESIARWLNLMQLVVSRVENYGCTSQQLDVIKEMRIAFQDQIVACVKALLSEMELIGSRLAHYSSPIGGAKLNTLSLKLSLIDGLLTFLGGEGVLDQQFQDKLAHARQFVADLVKRAQDGLVLTEFGRRKGPR